MNRSSHRFAPAAHCKSELLATLIKHSQGRLPGDIHVVREGASFHFPIVTCIILSVVISLILWIFRK
jgi:hypothetical protein